VILGLCCLSTFSGNARLTVVSRVPFAGSAKAAGEFEITERAGGTPDRREHWSATAESPQPTYPPQHLFVHKPA